MKRLLFSIAIIALTIGVAAKNGPGCGRKPLIGVSTNSSSYVTSIRKAGGLPVVIPAVSNQAEAAEAVAILDGMLFTGGEDVNPAYYGEEILNSTVSINYQRDTSEMLLIAAADKAGIPLMGICRGSQILNVYFGGTLYQDLPTQVPSNINHKQKEPGYIATHKDCVRKGTRMHKLFPVDSVAVNTTHHQAVKDLAPGMKATFVSPDGVIEGYESHKVIATQFHPEKFIVAGDLHFLPIFEEFIKMAGK